MPDKKDNALRKWFRKDPVPLRIFVSELLGTMIMTVIITCVMCQVILSKGQSGNMVSGFFGIILGITFSIYVSFKASGGFINPMITLVMVLYGFAPRRLLIVYWLAQYIGAFVGAATAYGVYYDAFRLFDGGNRTLFGETGTGVIFSSFPQNDDISIVACVFDQLVSSAILIIVILTIVDPANMQLPPTLIPPVAGLVIGMMIASFGHNSYAPLNPAKEFSSRIFMAVGGWGAEPFSYRGYTWFCIPLVVPHIGGVIGMYIYKAFLKTVLPPDHLCQQESKHDQSKEEVLLRDIIDSENHVPAESL